MNLETRVQKQKRLEDNFNKMVNLLSGMHESLKQGVVVPSERETFFNLYRQNYDELNETQKAVLEGQLQLVKKHPRYEQFFGEGIARSGSNCADNFNY